MGVLAAKVGKSTGAMSGLGKQGAQLAARFGPQGMLVGVALSLGVALVKAFAEPKKEIGDLMKEMDVFSTQLKKLDGIRFKEMEDSLESIIRRARDAAAAFVEMSRSQAESDDRAIKSADALREAEIARIKAMGGDASLELADLRAQQKQREIVEERVKLSTALAKKKQEEIDQVRKLSLEYEILTQKILTQENLIGESKAKKRPLFQEFGKAEEAEGTRWWAPGIGGMDPTKAQSERTNEAMGLIRKTNELLTAQKGELTGLLKEQQDLTSALTLAKRIVAQSVKNVADDLSEVDLTSKVQSVTAGFNRLGSQLAAVAKDVNEAADVLGPGAPQSVIARLAKLLEDGIKPQELEEITSLLQQMNHNVGVAYGKQNTTLADVIVVLERLQVQADVNQRKLDMLNSRSKTPIKGP
jgi:hypothetical protein